MYIRWIVRKHKSRQAKHVNFHDAYLVHSYRDRQGNPRQRTVAYLGNLREMDDTFPGIERELFLLRAHQILASLSELPPDEYQKLLTQLQQAAPPLSMDETVQAFQQNLYWYLHSFLSQGRLLPTTKEICALIEETKATLQAA